MTVKNASKANQDEIKSLLNLEIPKVTEETDEEEDPINSRNEDMTGLFLLTKSRDVRAAAGHG
jgi:hypothetical protein